MNTAARANMVLGALVADAAALGLHWLYDPDRIAQIAKRQGDRTAFTPIDAANFQDTKGYFAHADRKDGMLTQYGECLLLALRSILRTDGRYNANDHQTAFAAHFGPGGTYHGYIDRPTRGALTNIAADTQTPTGIDDDQLPATATLPAILAAHHGTPECDAHIRAAMELTNVNTVAAAYGDIFTQLLSGLLGGGELLTGLQAATKAASGDISNALKDALSTPQTSSTDYAETTGRACHLPMAGPLIFHILKHSTSFEDAVERNIRAGGDSAGRAILIGAVMGAVHGRDPERGIPLDWTLALQNGRAIWSDCTRLSAKT